VKKLHEEWFPLSYPDSFYKKINRNNVISIGCFAKINATDSETKENIIKEVTLGTILIKVSIGG
jgi:hypothetical protein